MKLWGLGVFSANKNTKNEQEGKYHTVIKQQLHLQVISSSKPENRGKLG